MPPPPPQRIGIIGGGVAGLACASRLAELGKDVVVFDTGKNAPGGRASSRRWEGSGAPVDHAAQFCSGSTQDFRRLLAQLAADGAIRHFRGCLGRLKASSAPGEPPILTKLNDGMERYHGADGMGSFVSALARGLDVRQDIWVPPSGGIGKLPDGSWEVNGQRKPH